MKKEQISRICSFQTFITCADRGDVSEENVQRAWSVSAGEDGTASVREITV